MSNSTRGIFGSNLGKRGTIAAIFLVYWMESANDSGRVGLLSTENQLSLKVNLSTALAVLVADQQSKRRKGAAFFVRA